MLTLHHLNDSRSQRILWLLEELAVPYEMKRYQRNPETRLAPPELKAVHPLGKSLSGADIQMSFVGDMAKVFNKLGPYPNLSAWLSRMHARPAFQRSIEKGGAYRFAK